MDNYIHIFGWHRTLIAAYTDSYENCLHLCVQQEKNDKKCCNYIIKIISDNYIDHTGKTNNSK